MPPLGQVQLLFGSMHFWRKNLFVPVHVRRCEPIFIVIVLELGKLMHRYAVAIKEREKVTQTCLGYSFGSHNEGVLLPPDNAWNFDRPFEKMLLVELRAELDA